MNEDQRNKLSTLERTVDAMHTQVQEQGELLEKLIVALNGVPLDPRSPGIVRIVADLQDEMERRDSDEASGRETNNNRLWQVLLMILSAIVGAGATSLAQYLMRK